MPMSDGKNRLKRIAFQIGNKFFRFAINPENYTDSRPHRTTAVKTKSRIVIEDFQNDIPTITIRGTTGFNPTGRAEDRGIRKIKEMKKFIEDYAKSGGNGNTPTEDFYFHNFTNDESFVIHLSSEGVTYTQDVSSPLTYRYEIKFVVLRKAGEPPDDKVIEPEIGNRFPSIPLPNPGGLGLPWLPNPIYNLPGIVIPSPGDIMQTIPNGGSNIYNKGSNTPYRDTIGSEPINPQAPSVTSYSKGTTGLGYLIGYYGRAN